MRRILVAFWVTSLLLAAGPSCALAWPNGETRDGFGTHDWVLNHAIELAGEDASWVQTQTALVSSDDPDTWRDGFPMISADYKLERIRHLYYPDSAYQGGPQAVADHYTLMVQALSARDTVTASRELGHVSHYYSDLLVPFHTLSYGGGSLEDGADHANYESAVGLVTQSPDAHREWISPLTPRPMNDVRARAIEAAEMSRSRMLPLISEYGTFEYYDPADDPESQILLNRAANDLADLIRSAGTGAGLPRPIASIDTWADYYYPALGRPARVWARVRDDRGRVVRGVKVSYLFQVAQPCTYVRFTDAAGTSAQAHLRVLGAVDVPFRVVVQAASAGTTLTSTVLLKPTQVIGTGASGLRTYTKYDATPAQGTTVTVVTHVQDAVGAPIQGIKVIYKFKHASTTVKKTSYTNSSGNAWYSRSIGASRAGRRVYVQADAYGGTEPRNTYDGIRTASTSFVPHSKVASLKMIRVTSAAPSRSTTATVRVRCADEHGAPIVGRIVGFSWKHKSGTTRTRVKTDSNGRAYVSRKVRNSELGFKMSVTASIRSGSTAKKSVVTFKPVVR